MTNKDNFQDLVRIKRNFFNSGETLDVEKRHAYLICLQKVITDSVDDISNALSEDLGRHVHESYMAEIGMVLSELDYVIRHLKKWAEVKKVRTPLSQFHSRSFIYPQPYGVILVVSPWNYPVQLSLIPLIGAIAAGNTVVLKPSDYSRACSLCLKKILSKVFPEEYVSVILGGREENSLLFDLKFDYIFFTGSPSVGRTVMSKAAQNLTPVTLELGGKSPVIVDETTNLKLCARRVAFGKIINSGQTCVAPDYLLIKRQLKDEFLVYYRQVLESFFPEGNYSEMTHIINRKHFERLVRMKQDALEKGAVESIRGVIDEDKLFISPSVFTNVEFNSPLMQEEIFGPYLPVIEYDDMDELIERLIQMPHPLALYLFSERREVQKKIISRVSFGGGCINDTVVHLASHHLGFGGIGNSGMGQYHGKKTFDVFTHYKSILKKSDFPDFNMRYHPYTASKTRLVKAFLK